MLLDTHVIVWLSSSPSQISFGARSAIKKAQESGSELFISPVSLYEISFLAKRNRIQMDFPIEEFLFQITSKFQLKPITARVAMEGVRFPPTFPGDPMDRIIAATALTEGMPLVTADERIRRSKVVKTIW